MVMVTSRPLPTGSPRVRGRARRCVAWFAVSILAAIGTYARAAETSQGPRIVTANPSGGIQWTGAPAPGVVALQSASEPTGPWVSDPSLFATNTAGSASANPGAHRVYFRLISAGTPATPQGFTNLASFYGIIETVAGFGVGRSDLINYWQPEFESGPATAASLSRPHHAMADAADNIYIVDKNSHSILKVTPDGLIHTVAGTHEAGDNGDGPAPATTLQLSYPNGLWVRADGTVYILDTGNGKVRKLSPDGVMTTLFTVGNGISTGRGLYVPDDESVVYFCSGSNLRQRVPGAVTTLNGKFTELGNIAPDPLGGLLVTDRGNHSVYHVDVSGQNAGNRTRIAGNGSTDPVVSGTPALNNGLAGVRGVWPVPSGGSLLATHEGSQLLFMDAAGIVYVLVEGLPGNAHSGDGLPFQDPSVLVSECRSVAMDYRGNILITENDFGFIRRIRFQQTTLPRGD